MIDTLPLPPYPKKDDPDFKEKKRDYMRAYSARPENKERKRVYNARLENKEREHASHLKRRYGLTIQEVDAMISSQNGLCFLCGKPPRGKKGNNRLYVDHCHKTGKVRALLCDTCNSCMGLTGDDPVILRKMATYIESYR